MTFSEQAPQVIIPQFDAFGITLAHLSCSAQTLRRVSSLKRCFAVYIYLNLLCKEDRRQSGDSRSASVMACHCSAVNVRCGVYAYAVGTLLLPLLQPFRLNGSKIAFQNLLIFILLLLCLNHIVLIITPIRFCLVCIK